MPLLLIGVLLSGCLSEAASGQAPGATADPLPVSVAPADAGCPARTQPIRVMPLGDSLTSGLHWNSNNDDSYRPYLWQMLQTTGQADVDFVGTSTTGDGSYDGDHQGRGGFSMGPDNGFADADGVVRSNLAYYLSEYREEVNTANLGTGQDWVTWAKPDVVLLNVGTNDAEPDAAKVYTRLNGLVQMIRQRAPQAIVIVSSIPPNGYDRRVFAPVGAQAQRIAAETDGRVLYADLYARMLVGNKALSAEPFASSDWNAPDDKVHFTSNGGRKMAAAWYPTVVQALEMVRCPTSPKVAAAAAAAAAVVTTTTRAPAKATRKTVKKVVKKVVKKTTKRTAKR